MGESGGGERMRKRAHGAVIILVFIKTKARDLLRCCAQQRRAMCLVCGIWQTDRYFLRSQLAESDVGDTTPARSAHSERDLSFGAGYLMGVWSREREEGLVESAEL